MEVQKEYYGSIGDKEIHQYTLTNRIGTQLKVINYGGIVTHLYVPDKDGIPGDIVCGFDNLSGYLGEHPYFGAIIGRYGNRIANGKFSIDGEEYQLPQNHGSVCLHGGIKDFSKHIWEVEIVDGIDRAGIIMHRRSVDLEEGFPGNLEVKVSYFLTNNNQWIIEYEATTDKATVINLTNHSYFNLGGHSSGSILDHLLKIDANLYTVLNEDMLPTGEIRSVTGTPFDFRKLHKIGTNMKSENPMIEGGHGYDLNYVLGPAAGVLKKIAEIHDVGSGRTMKVSTTEPGVQLYCSNWVDGIIGKNGVIYKPYCAVCLETQHFPDSPNHSHFPSTILRPEDKYSSTTIYTFGTST